MSLKEYHRKRQFKSTPEPKGKEGKKSGKGALRYVIQKHAASRTHYDFRLELDGTLKSWAVPKGPSLTSQEPRLAVQVEDHPIEYGGFEGTIPRGNYGAGTVMIWDSGTYTERKSKDRKASEVALRKGLADGHITIVMEGTKLHGEFALVQIKKKGAPERGWLLIKKHDEFASREDITKQDRSVATGRSMEEIAKQSEKRGDVWLPGKGKGTKQKLSIPLPKAPKKTATTKKATAIPRRLKPMEPVFAAGAPVGKDFLYEPFGQGVRAIAEVDPHAATMHSRSLIPFDRKYPTIVEALKKLRLTAVLDGEVIPDGKDFAYSISDMLFHSGKDLRELPLTARKAALAKLKLKPPLRLVKTESDPKRLTSSTAVAKKKDSAYHSGLSKEWSRFRSQAKALGTQSPGSDKPPLTNLTKIYFPDDGYTKGDLINYYDSIADYILPHLKDRPESLHRQPDGIKSAGFFHKDQNAYVPRQIETIRVFSESSGKTINYLLCQDKWALLYLANLGCIELNPWLSRKQKLENPDLVVIDLDPDGNPFKDVIRIALEVKKVLDAVGAKSYCKTSGASGIHICIPTGAKYDYDVGRLFAEQVCRIVQQKFPKLTSVERNPQKRMGKIYLDFLQNRRGQTLAAPYCVRPHPKAPVSTPLKWSELKPSLKPDLFTIKTIARRLARVGDLWNPLLTSAVDIEKCMKQLSKRFHI